MNIISLFSKSILSLLLLSAFSACGEASFKIKGDIYGAEDKSVVLEKSDFHGRWIPVDSTRTSKSGAFSFKRPAPAAPEIFRLALDHRYIYLPIDSVETLSLSTSAENFGKDYSVSGSDKAVAMAEFDKELRSLPTDISPDSLEAFKRNVFSKYMKDARGSIVGYYILTKTLGRTPLFNPSSDSDIKYFAAVATGFKETRPNDPHTALLEETSLKALRNRRSQSGTIYQIEAEEISVIEIELPDENGDIRKLSDIVGNGKPTVVMFTLLSHPDAPLTNIELSKLYDRLAGKVNFYQVGLDADQYAWRDAARNLPWITVYDVDGEYSKAALSYNVSSLPAFFVYDSKGELSSRASTVAELSKSLR